jgi:hypothetical protein
MNLLPALFGSTLMVQPVAHGEVDISQMDTIAGAIGGAVVVLIVVLILGYLMVKFKVVSIGGTNGYSKTDNLVMVMLEALKDKVGTLNENVERSLAELQECQLDLAKNYVQWPALIGPEGVITEIKKDRKEKWKKFYNHAHDPSSGVVIDRK